MRPLRHHRLVLVSGLAALSLALTGCLPDAITPLPGDVGEQGGATATAPIVPDTPLLQVKVIDDRGDPVAKARVRFDGATPMITANDGLVSVPWLGDPVEVVAAARGFTPATLVVDQRRQEPLELPIDPVVLRGRVTTDEGAGLGGADGHLGGPVRRHLGERPVRPASGRSRTGGRFQARLGGNDRRVGWQGRPDRD